MSTITKSEIQQSRLVYLWLFIFPGVISLSAGQGTTKLNKFVQKNKGTYTKL